MMDLKWSLKKERKTDRIGMVQHFKREKGKYQIK